MNTVALARILGRHLAVDDPANLSGDAALDVLTAINGGLEDFYRLAPASLRTTEFSATLRAPETMTVVFTGKYANTVGSPAFVSRQIGCTLRTANTPVDNRVSGVASVLDDHLSDTLTVAATLYGDAVAINARIAQITSAPRIYGATLPEGRELTRCTLREWWEARQAGEPCHYRIEPAGMNQGGETACLLRVNPLPAADYILRFSAELSGARRVTFSMLSEAEDLPVAATYCDSILAPLCEGKLTSSPLWADARTKSRIEDKAIEAVQKLNLIPNDFASPDNTVGTQEGF